MVGNISDSAAEMHTTAIRPTMFSTKIEVRQQPTPKTAMMSSSRAGRTMPSTKTITNRATRNNNRLPCSHQPAASGEVPTTSWA